MKRNKDTSDQLQAAQDAIDIESENLRRAIFMASIGDMPQLGSLPPGYAAQIQATVEEVGAPANVVGGYARNAPHPRKDIDYYFDVEYRALWTGAARAKLPGSELRLGKCWEANNTEFAWRMGWPGARPPGVHPPYIRFTPGQPPVWVSE